MKTVIAKIILSLI